MTPDDLPPSFQKSSLEGKVAVVTGGTQGLGEATARLFRERGCKGLVLTGRSAERGKSLANELTTDSCLAVFVRADLEDLDEVRNIFRVTDMTFGTVHILVNAAATTDRGSLWDTTPDDYNRIMNVNTRAPFFLMQDAARIMEREKVAGSIINISSTASYGSMPMIAAYGMSKGALNVATKNFAYSLMWSKIRVNALAIGWMDTPGEDAIQRRLHCGSDDNWKEAGEANQPFGRLLQPEEVARCIAFCASDESGMMTGCVIDFDQSVWGAGNAPVPPPKEEWSKAHGMTFSFQDGYNKKKSKTTTAKAEVPVEPKAKSKTSAKEDSKESKKSTPRSTPKSSPKASPKTSSPKEEKKKKRSKSNTPRSSPRTRRDDLKKSAKDESKKSTPRNTPKSSPKNSPKPSPKTGYILNASRAKMGSRRPPPPPPPVATVVVPGEDPVGSEPERQDPAIPNIALNKQDDEKVIPDTSTNKSDDQEETDVKPTENEVEPAEKELKPAEKEVKPIEVAMVNEEKKLAEITPPVSPEPEPPKISMEKNPAEVPYLDEARPSPTEFKQILEEKEGRNLNDSQPSSQKQAEFAKKKFSRSLSDNSSSHGDNNDYLPSSLSPKTTRKTVLPPKSTGAPQRKLQDLGEVIRPVEFFAENDPYGRKKERNNKKPLSRSSDHGDYRAARVQDWLGGDVGKAQRRSYKVKNVRELSSETSGD